MTEMTHKKLKYINWIGVYTLSIKELQRFIKIYIQSIFAPLVSTLLFYFIFHLISPTTISPISNVPYMEFLAPGLIMMSMAQNAFGNSSSSILASKLQGNLIDILLSPIGPVEFTVGYMIGGIARGYAVGLATILIMWPFHHFHIANIFVIVVFATLGCSMLSLIGVISGVILEKMDHMAVVTNFIIMPLTFLSGTFYTIDRFPPLLQNISHLNPFFYMIDGFRQGFIGYTDGYILFGLLFLLFMNVILFYICYLLLKIGYKLRY